jgi:hypothetical protein
MLQKKKGNRGKINEEAEAAEGAVVAEGEKKDTEDKDIKNIEASGSDDSEAEKQIK